MNLNKPINFYQNHFIFPKGRREYFMGQKEFITMPKRDKILVDNRNLWNCAKEIFIPISQLCANIKGVNFNNEISEKDKIGFYDIECDESENFILGYVNDKKFTDPKEMVKEMKNYDVLVSFNGYRFDNELLNRYAPEHFITINNADFTASTLNGVVMIDLFAMINIIVGLESYGAEGLAKSNKFPEEILNHDEDKDLKCQQDIRINKFLFEKYNIIKVFNSIATLSNLDLTLMQIIKGDRLRKWILINKYLRKGLLPLKTNMCRSNKVDSGVVRFSKKGIYEKHKYLDIISTYPQTAINHGNFGIYENDNTFSELQKELFDLSKDNDLKPFVKSIANALVGSEYSVNEYWRNDDIYETIVNTVADKVKNVLEQRKDIIYVNTDCFVIPQDSECIKIDGYEIKEKHNFEILYVYNSNKWIAKTKERIEFRGFSKLNSRKPKILQIARDEILKQLSKCKDKEEFKELLDDSDKLAKNTIKNLKKYPKDCFKITIRKKDEYCRDLEFSMIWDKLKKGFNEIFYDEDGSYILHLPKSYKYYKELINMLVKEYSTIIE